MQYDFHAIESKWRDHWAGQKTFRTPNPGDDGFDASKPKYYVLDMFPYPSGVGLHVGHPLGYIATDIVARYKRMRGFNVLHPMGYDAFGLPAEQFAVEHGVHPAETTQKNIENMTRQLKRLGLSYDWDRCLATCEPDYYKWTQWIFVQLFESYFDPVGRRAMPIATLVAKLEGEDYLIGLDGELIVSLDMQNLQAIAGMPAGVRRWYELEQDQKAALLNEYRLAYLAEVPVNWCPALGTVLANEEVTAQGRSERGNHPVFKRPLKQWMLRITAYTERLLTELDRVDWPEPIKLMQRNWIGRSLGAMVDFALAQNMGGAGVGEFLPTPADQTIPVYTTRPDTLFGATYMVLAPEHPLVEQITTPEQNDAVDAYRQQTSARSEIDRMAETTGGEKTGVFTGAHAINPANNKTIPIWIADYVLTGYGTGAIMAVPAHDQRDHDFARTFDLPITQVIEPAADSGVMVDISDSAFEDEGVNLNSASAEVSLNGLSTHDAKKKITGWLEDKGLGKAQVQYKLRDWLFSRQRYWGEPFPILHSPDGATVPVDDAALPVELPPMADFKPHTSDDPDAPVRTPLSRAGDEWKIVNRSGGRFERELNTMPQWAGSCWYYLRFCSPGNATRFVGEEAERYWMVSENSSGDAHAGGVDLYVGGAEHAVLHLLYARFWHKVLYDLGHVSTPEPFGRLFNQGYIQAYYYEDERKVRVPADTVVNQDGKPAFEVQGEPGQTFTYKDQPVTERYGKMGKSLKNAIAPDDMCERYGADSLRLYEMYLGPLEQSKPWATRDIIGVHRFLHRLWRNLVDDESGDLLVDEESPGEDLARLLHKTIKRVTDTMEAMTFNVGIAALIELNNAMVPMQRIPRAAAETLVILLAPMAPHICEELWQKLGHEQSLVYIDWPTYDPAMLVENTIEYPVQVMGKMRGKVTVPADADEQAVTAAALGDAKIAPWVQGKTVRKVVFVQGRLINIVAN